MISFFTEDIKFELDYQVEIDNWLNEAITHERKQIEEINYIFCSDSYLLEINQKYLQHDYYTDIITFPYSYNPIKSDIYVSIDRIRDNARTNHCDDTIELYRVIIHGLLHMMGYDDTTEQAQQLMTQKENFYLNLISWVRKK